MRGLNGTILAGLRSPRRIAACVAVAGLVVVGLGAYFVVPRTVAAVHPAMRVLATDLRGTGELAARNQTQFSSKTALRLQTLLVDTGDTVQTGQTLAVLDGAELRAEAGAAQAAVAQALATLDANREGAARARAQWQHAHATAVRSRKLAQLGTQAIAPDALEAAEVAEKTASLDVRSAQAQVAVAEQGVEQARRNLQAARVRVTDSRFVAPYDGLVTERHCSVGDTLSPGSVCLVLTQLTSLYVSARFDESVLATLQPGDAVRIYLKSRPEVAVAGRVDRLNRNVDADTREFTADIAFDHLPPGWAIGERVTVYVSQRAATPVLTLPRDFISPRGGRPGVWVAQAGYAGWQAVGTGTADAQYVQITSGLQSDSVVLRPGRVHAAQRVQAQLGAV